MKSLGQRAAGERLERMRASLRWAGDGFRNLHPVLAGLRDTSVPRPTVSDFLCGGTRRVPKGPLPSLDPRPLWARPVGSGLRATWLGHSTVLIEIDGLRVPSGRSHAPACPSSPRWAWERISRPSALRTSASPSSTGGSSTRCPAAS